MSEPDWNDFRFLVALSKSGSVAGAARLLSVDNSTVSRRLAAIEQALDAQLLLRGGREFSWTAEGLVAVAAAERIGAEVQAVTRAVHAAKRGVDGMVRLTCPSGMAGLLASMVKQGAERYPALTIEITGKRANVDLARGEADIAVRMVKPTEPDLVARAGVEAAWVLVTSEVYARAHALPKTEHDVKEHPLILYAPDMHTVAGPRWLEERRGDNPGLLRVENSDAAAYAISSGRGIGVVPQMTIHDRSGFVRVFPRPVAVATAWIVYHESNRDSARVRAVVDLLVEFFDNARSAFMGECGGA